MSVGSCLYLAAFASIRMKVTEVIGMLRPKKHRKNMYEGGVVDSFDSDVPTTHIPSANAHMFDTINAVKKSRVKICSAFAAASAARTAAAEARASTAEAAAAAAFFFLFQGVLVYNFHDTPCGKYKARE